MHDTEKLTLKQIARFLEAAEASGFTVGWSGCCASTGTHSWLVQLAACCAALHGQRRDPGEPPRRNRFPRHYTPADIELLARVDEAHETLSGPATRRVLQREFHEYGRVEFERLASISNGHLYNLRHSTRYRQRLRRFEKTRLDDRCHTRSNLNPERNLSVRLPATLQAHPWIGKHSGQCFGVDCLVPTYAKSGHMWATHYKRATLSSKLRLLC